jgi:exodeoxyribonuclease VII small subunit
MAAKKKAVDFEQSLALLEALVNKMEHGDLSLEASLQAFSTGIQLTRECQTRLAEAEQQVSLLQEEQGDISLSEFDPSDDECA